MPKAYPKEFREDVIRVCVPSSWGPRFRMGKFPTSGVWC